MLNPVLWLLIFGIAGTLTTGAALSMRRQRRCPACRSALVALEPPEGSSYEVMACPHCPSAVTLAVGHRARFSWCPSCKQRALETPCIRHPDPNGALVVEVREHCHLCPHERMVLVEAASPPRGLVVEFPRRTGTGKRGG